MSKSAKRVFKIVGIAALGLATWGVSTAFFAAGGFAAIGSGAVGAAVGSATAFGVAASTLVTVGLAALSIGTLPDVPSLEKTGANNRGQATMNPDALGVFAFGETTVPDELIEERR